jgi:pimeloyl-ACP methyl ester carboxylesterase
MPKSVRALAVLFALLATSAVCRAQDPPRAPKLEGFWLGPLKSAKGDVRLGFSVFNRDGKLAGTLDSVDQGQRGIPFSSVSYQDGKVRFEIAKGGIAYEGTMNKDGTEIAGEWIQGPAKVPLTLKRVDRLPGMNRPQEPKGPFPYVEEEVVCENKKANVKLAGTLTLPKGDGPFPAVFLITGSGPQDRDSDILGHKLFLVIADYLTRRGVAVLRVDDRGFGKSTGDFADATTADFAEDAEACVAFLKAHKKIDAKKIGLIGHSEGGQIAPMVASRSKDVAFIVLLAGPGLRGDEILKIQLRLLLEAEGADKATVDRRAKFMEIALPIVQMEADNTAADKKIYEAVLAWRAKSDDAEKKAIDALKPSMGASVRDFTTKWNRYFISHDPVPALKKVACPVLALNGSKDLQVPSKVNLEAIEKALKEGGNKDFTIKELPNLNHLFQTCKTGAFTEYGAIEETVAPVVLETMADWIAARVKKD